jgi:cell division protein FtsQ
VTDKGRKILKWSILMGLLCYAAGMTVWAHQEANKHVCTGIEIHVEGSAAMDSVIRHGVTEELRDYPVRITGTPLHQLNTVDVERYLARYSNFESVNCMISSHGKLIVKIVPLVPVMRVFFADYSYYINKEGKHIESNAEFFSDVPVVSGSFNRRFQPKSVLPLVNYIRKDPMLSELVSMVVAENENNLILVPRIRGHVINFGDTTRLDEKKRALTLFYRQVMPYKGWQEYDTISVKFRDQVVATRRDKTRLNHMESYEEEIDLEEATLPDADNGHPHEATPDNSDNKPQDTPQDTKQQG